MSQLRWFILILVISLVIISPSPTHADELEASVEVLESGVEIMEVGTKKWQDLRADALVTTGDRIRTDESGLALITWFADGTFIELQPNSEIIIEEFSADNDNFVIDASLIQGSLFNSVRRLLNRNSSYHINTSNMTATVRGTVFSVSINAETMDTTLVVVEGTVNAQHPENEDIFIPVPAGNYLTISSTEDFFAESELVSLETASTDTVEIIENLEDFYEEVIANPPEDGTSESEDDAPESDSIDVSDGESAPEIPSNGGGNGNGNNGNGNGNGGSNGNTNNGNGNTGGNNGGGNGGGNGNGNNGNGNGNGGSNGNTNNGNGNTGGNNGGGSN